MSGTWIHPRRPRTKTPPNFDCSPINLLDLNAALDKAGIRVRELCLRLHCRRQAIYIALHRPERCKNIASQLRTFIAEAKQA